MASELAPTSTSEIPLCKAAFLGSIEDVTSLLSNGTNHRVWNESGWTALHWAVAGGHLTVVQKLLDHHARSQVPDPEFHQLSMEQIETYAKALPPITLAAETQNPEIFRELAHHLEVPKGHLRAAKLNPIWEEGNYDVPRSILSANLWRVTGKGERINGFEWAIPGKIDLTRQREATPDQWMSMLMRRAICDQQWESLQMLIKAGADVNYRHAIHDATFRSDPRYVECFLQNGADPNTLDGLGRTALNKAVLNGFLDTTAALIDGGADVNHQVEKEKNQGHFFDTSLTTEGFEFTVGRQGASPLMEACGFLLGRHDKFRRRRVDPAGDTQAPEKKTFKIVRLLLLKGADPNLQDSLGMTVLHYAVLQPHLPLIKLLIEAGSPVHAIDQEGRIPLHYLARCDENDDEVSDLEEIVRLLCGGNATTVSSALLNKPVSGPPRLPEDQSNRKRSSLVQKVIRVRNVISHHPGKDDTRTPIEISLLGSRWKMARILAGLGAVMPPNMDVAPVIDLAVKDMQAVIINLLLRHRAPTPPASIVTLVKSFISRFANQQDADNDLYSTFKCILTAIILHGAEINFCDSTTEDVKTGKQDAKTSTTSPLALAATMRGSRQILKNLLVLGADAYFNSSHTFDPILTAALFAGPEDLASLLDHAASHPHDSHWSRYLAHIPKEEDPIVRVCHCLKEAGALNATNAQGRTLMHLAAEQGNVRLLESLLSEGASTEIIDQEGFLAMHCAGFARQPAALEELCASTRRTYSEEDFDLPIQTDLSLIQKILPDPGDLGHKRNMVDVAFGRYSSSMPMITLLLQLGVDPNYKIEEKIPALYHAAKGGSGQLVSLLLSYNADIEASDPYGWRPLHLACYRGHTEIARTLIEKGADVHCTTRGWNDSNDKPTGLYMGNAWKGTPLHLAAMGGHLEIAKMLLDKSVDIHASTKPEVVDGAWSLFFSPGHGPSALHLALDMCTHYGRRGKALSEERLRIAQLLVDAGAMVHGVLGKMDLQEMLEFRNSPGLWDALVAGDVIDGGDASRHEASALSDMP